MAGFFLAIQPLHPHNEGSKRATMQGVMNVLKTLKEGQHYRVPDGREVLLMTPYDSTWLCKTPAHNQSGQDEEFVQLTTTIISKSVLGECQPIPEKDWTFAVNPN